MLLPQNENGREIGMKILFNQGIKALYQSTKVRQLSSIKSKMLKK